MDLLEKFAPKKKEKNPGINLGQPTGKGRKKKTLVLTLGSAIYRGRFCHRKCRGQFCHRKNVQNCHVTDRQTYKAITIVRL
jgi:hypothetical protein